LTQAHKSAILNKRHIIHDEIGLALTRTKPVMVMHQISYREAAQAMTGRGGFVFSVQE
jgi:hypothetical protein